MKKFLIGIISLGLFCLNGCGVHWSHESAIKAINNKYFQSEIMWQDDECIIIRNSITEEYFILIIGPHGGILCPIEVNEDMKEFLVGEKNIGRITK